MTIQPTNSYLTGPISPETGSLVSLGTSTDTSKTANKERKVIEELSAPENSKTLTLSITAESISKQIQEYVDSDVSSALFNARSGLFSNLYLLGNMPEQSSATKIKAEERNIKIFAALILLSLCNGESLLANLEITKNKGEEVLLEGEKVIYKPKILLKDMLPGQVIKEAANYIKISAAESNATVTFTPNPKNADEIMGISANYNYGGEGRKTINIELTSPLNMGKIKADALAYILQNQENTTPPNNR
jgi:hypothetical protein